MANIIRGRQTLPISRRRLLKELALGTSAFGLAGCGEKAQAQVPVACEGVAIARDEPLLETLAVMEDIAARTYQAAEGLLSAELRPAAAAFAEHHVAHRDDALARLVERGSDAPTFVESLTNLPELPDDLSILRYAYGVEKQAVNAYLGLISQFAEPGLRARAADILGCEIAHVIALRTVLPGPEGTDGDVIAAAAFDFVTDLVRPPAPTYK